MKSGFLCRLSAGWRSYGHFLLPQLAALMLVATMPLSPVRANMPGTFQPVLLASQSSGALSCTGGTVTAVGPNRVHTFTSASSLVCTGAGTVHIMSSLQAAVAVAVGLPVQAQAVAEAQADISGASTSLFTGTFTVTVGAAAGGQ